jgi:peptidoglycan-N-acetylglucosamine deacetylase
LGELVRERHLRAEAGRLLAVDGEILRRRDDPGVVLVNGVRPPRSSPLSRGDHVAVVNGEDRTEPTIELATPLPAPVPQNPASRLGTAPSEEVTIEGKISGTVVRQFTRATERVARPNRVALTFDDGPWPGATERILRILRRYRVKASFFVVGALAERYPMLVRREVRAGMTVGNHSWSHPIDPPFRDLAVSRVRLEMSRANSVIERFEHEVELFRPPGGTWDDDVRSVAGELGMRLVLWDIDPRDWRRSTTQKDITRAVLSRVRAGSIVLLHDGGGDAAQTIAALPDIIEGIRERGFKLVAL